MSENAAAYPTPDPPLEDVRRATDALAEAESEAIKGGTDRTVARNARLNELTELMNRLVDYVQLESGGVPEKISQAGMSAKRDPAPWPLPAQTENLQARPGTNPGTVVLSWDATPYRKSYVLEIWVEGGNTPPDDPTSPGNTKAGSWQVLVIQGKSGYEAIGLSSGKNYRFRVAAQNSAGLGSYSDEAQSVAR